MSFIDGQRGKVFGGVEFFKMLIRQACFPDPLTFLLQKGGEIWVLLLLCRQVVICLGVFWD